MALTKTQIQDNKNRFEEILRRIEREGNIEELIKFLNNSDFFYAPATTQYHYSYEGGLCEKSLRNYQTLLTLASNNDYCNIKYDDSTLIIVGLLYNLSKINYYEKYVQNKKVYKPNGTKYDEIGKYDWVSTHAYKVIEPTERYVAGDSGFNSYMILSRYLLLNDEEIIALKNYNCGMDNNYMLKDLYAILTKYPLVSLLHIADMISSYIISEDNNESVD